MKKTLFILLMFFILISCEKKRSLNDSCESYFSEQKDNFTKESIFSSSEVMLSDIENQDLGRLKFISHDLEIIKIPILLNDKFCTDEFSKVIFLYEDESTSGYFIQHPYNCEGNIIIENPVINDFSSKIIKGIRVQGSTNFVDYYLNSESKELFQKTFKCYMENIDKLKNA